jgi:hypothetical protein
MSSLLVSLPEEILINIFKFLYYDQLKNLKPVCRLLHYLIEHHLKDREWLIIDDNSEFFMREIILNLKVHSSHIARLNKCLDMKTDGKLIKSLYIHNLYSESERVDLVEFKNVLICCSSLKHLSTSVDFIKKKPHEKPYPADLFECLPALDLDSLTYSKEMKPFQLFMNCSTKRLNLFFGLDKFMSNAQSIKDFLKRQKKLVDLELWFSGRALPLFSDDQLSSVDFKLKKLKMVGKGLQCSDIASFGKFMANHKSSLEHLEMFSCHNIIDTFMHFENLKTVDLKEVHMTSEPFVHVDRLRLKNVTGNYIGKFPNIKHLFINTHDLTRVDFCALKRLKSVEFSVLKIDDILLPCITDLKLVCVNSFSQFRLPCTVEVMTLKDCMNVDWLADYLKQNKRLRSVKIIGSSITERLARSVRKMSQLNNCLVVL